MKFKLVHGYWYTNPDRAYKYTANPCTQILACILLLKGSQLPRIQFSYDNIFGGWVRVGGGREIWKKPLTLKINYSRE